MANDINFDDIPVRALRTATRSALATLLNPIKVIPSPKDLPRDWRGLEHLTGEKVCRHDNPVEYILQAWEKCDTATLGLLQTFLAQLDRYDVLDDTREMMYDDAENYVRKIENGVGSLERITTNLVMDQLILTVDDVCRLEKGLAPQYYDAFLLYADDDVDFAMRIVDKLENYYNLKLCLKDRDLIGGLTFEHEAIMRLIAERCQRLVVVVSQSFLNSSANKFFVTFAQALGIEQRQRKVVPCLYTERFKLPVELTYYFLLDYTRSGKLWNFWEKLRDSICAPNPTMPALPAPQGVTLKEIGSKEHRMSSTAEYSTKNRLAQPAITDGNDYKSSYKKHVVDDTTTKLSALTVTSKKFKQPSSPTTLLRSILSSKAKSVKNKDASNRLFKKKKKEIAVLEQ